MIKHLFQQFIQEEASKKNHFFTSTFYQYVKKMGYRISLEEKKKVRDFVKYLLDKGVICAQKTQYKSNKVYLFFKSKTLSIRQYIQRQTWKDVRDSLVTACKNSAPKKVKSMLYKKLLRTDMSDAENKEKILEIAAKCVTM